MKNDIHPQQARNAKYVVMDEHTLGYLLEETPNYIGVLAGSVLRGGRNPLDGPAIVTPGLTRLRPATETDFEFFRHVLPIDFVWEDGGSERERWDAGQQVLNRYVWPNDLEIIGRRGWNLVTRQHLQCFIDVCYLGRSRTSCDSGRIKVDFHVEFDQSGTVAEAYALDKHKQLVGYRGDVDLGPAAWTTKHEEAAAREGWLLSDCDCHKQLQRIDDPEAYRDARGFLPPTLANDDAAFRAVANGRASHHLAIRAILRERNLAEYAAVMACKTYAISAGTPTAQ
jgi:hypothetical protein